MEEGEQHKSNIQLIWGVALILVGFGVLVKIEYVMPQLTAIGAFGGFSRFGLYLIGIILIGGGIKKIVSYLRSPHNESAGQLDSNGDDG